MYNDIQEVDRDDYAGFIGQLNKTMMDVEQIYEEHITRISIVSKKTNTLLCTRIITDEGEEKYFIYNMPLEEERIAPKPVMKITLDSKEQVQAFFDALNKLQGAKTDD